MPALQVRDFPDDLYEQLKSYAASQHRSIAQQTIVAVEEMLAAQNTSHYWDGGTLHRVASRPRYLDFDTEAQRAERIKKRKELFAEIHALPKIELPDDFPSVAELVRQGREERGRELDERMERTMLDFNVGRVVGA
ncbi:MAG: argininosuccinate lyase [Gordonibacter sp.]|uniref:argininosuccinate lyase n=1 Tax=Gordonibacter sp. TaxID=1968902 RepID=UPI002FCC04E0